MSAFLIEGGARLSGRFVPAGNKNAALPVLAGCLLTRETVRLENVPDILDVRTLLTILESLGVETKWTGPNALELSAAGADGARLDPRLVAGIRGSVLLAGPMLARFGAIELPEPGGDFIGRRRLDTHLLALRSLGADVEVGNGYLLRTRGLSGTSIFLDEPSVTGTENAILAAVTTPGTTVLRNSASEPHVQDLCRFLSTLGARIDGVGTHRLTIEGVEALGGGTHRIGPDHIEIGSLIGLAATTGSTLRIAEVDPDTFDPIRIGFQRLGIEFEWREGDLAVRGEGALEIQPDAGDQIPKIDDGPWPAFPADLISIALVTATRCRGTVLIHEKMFESRLFFVDKLVTMGARIVLCDPHRAVVVGPSRLRGRSMESPDIRAGMAMLIAALAADGRSRIENIQQIERGYQRIDERLNALGASIERVED